jgi:hypothetical protein
MGFNSAFKGLIVKYGRVTYRVSGEGAQSLLNENNSGEGLTLSCQRGEYGELLIMPVNGRWDLTRLLKG